MKTDYSKGEAFLHNVTLSSKATKTLQFDLEKRFFLRTTPEPKSSMFICGLARAGTTALLNALHQSGVYASPTFEDMPFILCPNLWHSISGRFSRTDHSKERAHGDGLQISASSPEALDEIFWSLSDTYNDFTDGARVKPYDLDVDALSEFENFAALYCRRYGKARYLSKNNNNIFRLDSLARHSPDATFLLPFRMPDQQAFSLYSQHANFMDIDHFGQAYMTWLGHFEFGKTHRRYKFPESIETGLKPTSPDYWLNTWYETYRYALSAALQHRHVIPVCYERLCGKSGSYLKALSLACGADLQGYKFIHSSKDHQWRFDQSLLEDCGVLYDRLLGLSHERLDTGCNA